MAPRPALNALDRLIGWVSPAAALRRARERSALHSFEAGRRRVGQRNWRAPPSGPNAEIDPALELLRSRSRQMVRDNPYCSRAVQVLVAHQIGTGIVARIAEARLQSLWDRWAKVCDHDGIHDLGGLMALAARARSEGGEALIRMRVVTQAEARRRGLPQELPLTLQVLEGDMLPLHTTLLPGGPNRIVQGVEFAADGSRAAYHLRRRHPGEAWGWTAPLPDELERVPADQVVHLFRALRPGQVRGYPDLAPVLVRLKQLDDYEAAALDKARAEALLSIFFEGDPQLEVPPNPADPGAVPTVDLYPGSVHDVPPGKTVKFLEPSDAGPFEPYALHQLFAAAAGYGVTYDQLTGDYRQANYSSLRAGKIEFRRTVEQDQWLMLVPRMCEPIFRFAARLAAIAGVVADGDAATVEWQPPRFEMIDPAKEIPAAKSAVRSGFATWDQTVAGFGYEPGAQALEIKRANARFDRHGLILDSDPRRTNGSGGAHDARQNAAIEIAATGAALPPRPQPAPPAP